MRKINSEGQMVFEDEKPVETKMAVNFFDMDGNAISLNSFGTVFGNNPSKVPVVQSCVSILVDTLLKLQPVTKRNKKEVEDHPLTLLYNKPSDVYDSAEFWELMYTAYVAEGNAYAFIQENIAGRPEMLIRAQSSSPRWLNGRVVHDMVLDDGRPLYEVPDSRVLALHNRYFDGLISPSPVDNCRGIAKQVCDTIDRIGVFTKRGFDGMLTFSPIDSLNDLGNDGFAKLTQIIEDLKNRKVLDEKVLHIPAGMKLDNINNTTLADLIQSKDHNLHEICRIFRLPPRMVYFHMRQQRAELNFLTSTEDFYRDSIIPHTIRILSQFNKKLVRLPNTAIEFDLNEAMKGTLSEQAGIVETLVAKTPGWTPNEGREYLGKEPIDKPEYNELLSPKGSPDMNQNQSQPPEPTETPEDINTNNSDEDENEDE